MISKSSKDALILVPGWATDGRVFEPFKPKGCCLLPAPCPPDHFNEKLLRLMDEAAIEKASLLGWSLGGFLAADFASRNPGRVCELFLVSVRERYDPEKLKEMKAALEKNKKATLYKFYLGCFSRYERDELSWFKKHLLKDYIDGMELDVLNDGLDYLSGARIVPGSLAVIQNITFFHGEEDAIVPLQEALKIRARFPGARWVPFPRAGHMPFLKQSFQKHCCPDSRHCGLGVIASEAKQSSRKGLLRHCVPRNDTE